MAALLLALIPLAIGVIMSPIAIPVLKDREADAVLRRVRTWIAGHTSTLNAGLLLLIGAMQRQKALSALLGGE